MSEHITLELDIIEEGEETTAHARLDLHGDHFESYGKARRNPTDPDMPLIGQELAAARALASIAAQVMETARGRIHQFLV